MFPEGGLRPDTLTVEDLRRDRSVVLPDSRYLEAHQGHALAEYLDTGSRLVVGGLGDNLAAAERAALVQHAGVMRSGALRVDSAAGRSSRSRPARTSPGGYSGWRAAWRCTSCTTPSTRRSTRCRSFDRLSSDLRVDGGYATAVVHAPSGSPAWPSRLPMRACGSIFGKCPSAASSS